MGQPHGTGSQGVLSVVIPALNEERTVAATVRQVPFERLREMGLDIEIMVVDNASSDRTGEEARSAGATVIVEARRGYGNAYIAGFRAARGNLIVMADADGTYPLEEIPSLITPLLERRADLVTGSRLRGHLLPGAMPPLHRYVGVPLLTWTLNLLFGLRISDAHCGMRAVTRSALDRMGLRSEGMELASEMLVAAGLTGARVMEIPIEYRPRPGAPSKLRSFRDGWRHLRYLILQKLTLLRWR